MARVRRPRADEARGRSGLMEVFKGERAFALLLVAPAFLALLLTTTFPLGYLLYNSFFTINLSMPFLDGFAGLDQLRPHAGGRALLARARADGDLHADHGPLAGLVGLGLALLVLQIPERAVAVPDRRDPAHRAGAGRRRPDLALALLTPQSGIVDLAAIALGFGSFNWLGSPDMALVSVIAVHTWQWTPFAFLVFLASLASVPPDLYEAARIDRANALQALHLHHAAADPPGDRDRRHPAHDHRALGVRRDPRADRRRPGTATEILNLYAYRTAFIELNFGYGSALAVTLLIITLIVSAILFRIRTAR